MTKKIKNRITGFFLVVAMMVTSLATGGLQQTQVAQAATAPGIANANGSVSGSYNGSTYSVTLTDAKADVTINGSHVNFIDTNAFESFIDSADGMGHFFFASGPYIAMDMTNGAFLILYYSARKYESTDASYHLVYCTDDYGKMNGNNHTAVKGSSVLTGYKSAIIDREYYYQTSSSLKSRFITRDEFYRVLENGTSEETVIPTIAPVPTEQPTQAPQPTPWWPTPTPTVQPTQTPWWPVWTSTPTVQPTQAPQPTATPQVTSQPTATPQVTPTPTATPQVTSQPTATPWWPVWTPTPQPTQAPVPTVQPTQAPQQPTMVPAAEINAQSEFEFKVRFYWDQYEKGKITWEQYCQLAGVVTWEKHSGTTEEEDIYYLYDEKGNVVQQHRVLHSDTNETGKADVNVNEQSKGTASSESEAHTIGEAEVNGQSNTNVVVNVDPSLFEGLVTKTVGDINSGSLTLEDKTHVMYPKEKKTIPYYATNAGGKEVKAKIVNCSKYLTVKVKSKNKIKITVKKKAKGSHEYKFTVKNGALKIKVTVYIYKPRVVVSGSRRKLFTKENELHGWAELKAGKLNWNGLENWENFKFKSIDFIEDSWNVAGLTTTGKLYSIAKSTGTVKLIATNVKCLRRTNYGFAKVAVLKDNKTTISIIGK